MMARRSAFFSRWQAGAILGLGLGIASGFAPAAPFRSPRAATPAPKASAVTTPAHAEPPLIADALPTARLAPADLQLTQEAERRANAFALFARGVVAEDSADTETALESYRKAFDLDPSNAELAIKLAYLFAQRNDVPSGIEVLKDAVKAAPREAMPLIYLSQLYAKYLKKNEQALRFAEQALTLDPKCYAAYLAIFELQTAMGQNAKAEAVLQQGAKSTSNDPQFWLQLGGLFARAYLKEDGTPLAPDLLPRVNAIYRKAATLGQSDALVLAKVGNHFVTTRQAADAIPYYQAALRLQQTSDDPILLNAGDKLARALSELGRRKEAIEVLEGITRDNPLRFETYELLGELYEQSEEIDQALANYQRSLLLDASEPRNHIRVAYMQLRKKRFKEAVETSRAARARFPDDPDALYLLAIALSEAKMHTEAMAVYAEALNEFKNGHEDLLNAQFYYSYGAAAEQAGLISQAVDLLKKSIELAPNNSSEAYNFLGYMWVERGENLDEAGEMIKKAMASEPDNGAFMDSFGWYYFKKGDFEKALQELLKAAETIKPEDAVVFEHVGDTYQQLGKTALALQYWQKAQAIDGDNKKVAEKIEAAKQKVSSNTVKPGEK